MSTRKQRRARAKRDRRAMRRQTQAARDARKRGTCRVAGQFIDFSSIEITLDGIRIV